MVSICKSVVSSIAGTKNEILTSMISVLCSTDGNQLSISYKRNIIAVICNTPLITLPNRIS